MEKQICAYILQAKKRMRRLYWSRMVNVVFEETTEDLSPVKVYETEGQPPGRR